VRVTVKVQSPEGACEKAVRTVAEHFEAGEDIVEVKLARAAD
jgi:hypothetical protein